MRNPSERKAYIITGPTSGIGRATAFEVAKHGTIVLVGRDKGKLAATLAFARETPRLRFNAVEPGITPGSGLGASSLQAVRS